MENDLLDSPVKRTRERTITKMLGENKNYLNEDDIWKIVETMKLENVSKEKAKEIFYELDRDKTGSVPRSDFMEFISNAQGKEMSIEAELFSRRIRKGIYTKAEKIIHTLKKLLQLEQISNDIYICSELTM